MHKAWFSVISARYCCTFFEKLCKFGIKFQTCSKPLRYIAAANSAKIVARLHRRFKLNCNLSATKVTVRQSDKNCIKIAKCNRPFALISVLKLSEDPTQIKWLNVRLNLLSLRNFRGLPLEQLFWVSKSGFDVHVLAEKTHVFGRSRAQNIRSSEIRGIREISKMFVGDLLGDLLPSLPLYAYVCALRVVLCACKSYLTNQVRVQYCKLGTEFFPRWFKAINQRGEKDP